MGKVRRIAYLTEDAKIFGDSVQLHYTRGGFSSLGAGPPASVCPPAEMLKKGTKVRLTVVGQPRLAGKDIAFGKITKVELA